MNKYFIGSLIKIKNEGSGKHVRPVVTPLNQTDEYEYPETVHEDYINKMTPTKANVPGILDCDWVVVMRAGVEQGVPNNLNQGLMKKNEELKDKVKTLQQKVTSLQQRLRNYSEGAKSIVKESEEIAEGTKSKSPRLSDDLRRDFR